MSSINNQGTKFIIMLQNFLIWSISNCVFTEGYHESSQIYIRKIWWPWSMLQRITNQRRKCWHSRHSCWQGAQKHWGEGTWWKWKWEDLTPVPYFNVEYDSVLRICNEVALLKKSWLRMWVHHKFEIATWKHLDCNLGPGCLI